MVWTKTAGLYYDKKHGGLRVLTSFIRTVLLLFFVILCLRLMGKRQIGQLQPSELVVTILLSQIAATPMQDNDIPMLNTVVSILALAGVEILLSALSMKSGTVRMLVDGSPIEVIADGKIDQNALKRLRYTIDDLLEGLRQKDIFDISQVQSAVAETNGGLSVQLKAGEQPLSVSQYGKDAAEPGVPAVLIKDGKPDQAALKSAGLDLDTLQKLMKRENAAVEQVFLLTLDATGKTFLVRKESSK